METKSLVAVKRTLKEIESEQKKVDKMLRKHFPTLGTFIDEKSYEETRPFHLYIIRKGEA